MIPQEPEQRGAANLHADLASADDEAIRHRPRTLDHALKVRSADLKRLALRAVERVPQGPPGIYITGHVVFPLSQGTVHGFLESVKLPLADFR